MHKNEWNLDCPNSQSASDSSLPVHLTCERNTGPDPPVAVMALASGKKFGGGGGEFRASKRVKI